jgi:hypothetical protein
MPRLSVRLLILNVVTLAATLVMNWLANALPLNGRDHRSDLGRLLGQRVCAGRLRLRNLGRHLPGALSRSSHTSSRRLVA